MMTKADVRGWVASLRHRNIARREERCMTCSNTPRIMKIEIAKEGGRKGETEEQAIWWCVGCNAPAFGSASYTNDRKLDYSQLEAVDAKTLAGAQQELF